MTSSVHIRTLDEYRKFKLNYPNASLINENIFENPDFIGLTYNPGSIKDNPLWKVTYTTSEGIVHQATEKQLVQFMLRKKSNEFDKAVLGLISWEGRPIAKVSGEKQNFMKMITRFFPEDSCAGVFDYIEDKFFKTLAVACNGWKIDSKNFENSPKKGEIVRMENKPRFIKVKPVLVDDNYTEDDIREISKQIYEEECEAYGKYRLNILGRHIVNERANERLLRETGYKFDYMEYDAEYAWFDPNTTVIASYIIGNFCKALNYACQYIHPGSSAGWQELKDEKINPIAATPEYKRSAREGLDEFGDIFGLTNNSFISNDEYMVNNFVIPKVEAINQTRGKNYYKSSKSKDPEKRKEEKEQQEKEIVLKNGEVRRVHKTTLQIAEAIYLYYQMRKKMFR